MSFIPKPHEIYKHFKGNLYQITAIAEHTETGELLVIYQALYDEFKTYARPLSMFTQRVDRRKYPDAVQEFRFELQGPDAERQEAESEEPPSGQPGAEFVEPVQKKQSIEPEETVQKQQGVEPKESVQKERSVDVDGSASERQGTEAGQPKERLRMFDSEQQSIESKELIGQQGTKIEEQAEELSIDPLVLEFLDADNYGQRLNILAGLHHRITDDMITTMAIACDIEISDGNIEERYEALKTCLLTLERYECNRLR